MRATENGSDSGWSDNRQLVTVGPTVQNAIRFKTLRMKSLGQTDRPGLPQEVKAECLAKLALSLFSVPQQEFDGCGEGNGGEEDVRAPFAARDNLAPVFQALEHDLVPVAALVAALIVLDGFSAQLPAREKKLYTLISQRFAEESGIAAPVFQQSLHICHAAAPLEPPTSPAVMKRWVGRTSEPVTESSLMFMPPFIRSTKEPH